MGSTRTCTSSRTRTRARGRSVPLAARRASPSVRSAARDAFHPRAARHRRRSDGHLDPRQGGRRQRLADAPAPGQDEAEPRRRSFLVRHRPDREKDRGARDTRIARRRGRRADRRRLDHGRAHYAQGPARRRSRARGVARLAAGPLAPVDALDAADRVAAVDPGAVEARAARDSVTLAVTREDAIVAPVAEHEPRVWAGPQLVIAGAAEHQIVPAPRIYDVIARAHEEEILVSVSVDDVVARRALLEARARLAGGPPACPGLNTTSLSSSCGV